MKRNLLMAMLNTAGDATNRTLSASDVGCRSHCVGEPATEGSNAARGIWAIGHRNGAADIIGLERPPPFAGQDRASGSGRYIPTALLHGAVFLEDRATECRDLSGFFHRFQRPFQSTVAVG